MELITVITTLNQAGRAVADFLHPIFDNAFYFFLFIAIVTSVAYYFISISILFFDKTKKKSMKKWTKKITFCHGTDTYQK